MASSSGIDRLRAVAWSLGVLTGGAAAQSPATPATPAFWQEHDATFTYVGIGTHYSCDGLRERMRELLLALGARSDLSVTERGCSDYPGHLGPFPAVDMHFASLQPARAPAPAAAQGQWLQIDLARSARLDGGECELLEQVAQQILPYFSVRQAAAVGHCIPHTLEPRLSLPLEVLVNHPAS